jgi:hypothetical protein
MGKFAKNSYCVENILLKKKERVVERIICILKNPLIKNADA